MEEALDLVKQHQYISLAVDGKKNRRGREDISVNAVQASSEVKTEELIAFALKEFAKKMHITPPSAVVRETQPSRKPQRWGPCFFCGRMGHWKRDCIQFQELLKKKENKHEFKRQGAGREDHTSKPTKVKTDGLPERSIGKREIGAISKGRVCDSKVFKKSQQMIYQQKQQQSIKSVDVLKQPVNCGPQVNQSAVTDSFRRVFDSPNMLEVPKHAVEGSSQNSSQHTLPVSVIISVGGACGSPTRKEQMQKDPLSQQEVQSSLSQSDDGRDKESTEQGTSSRGPSDSIKICRVQAGSSVVQITVGDLLLNANLDSGAEITILSSRMYDKLKKAPKKVQDVVMQMADAETAL
ncbi:hypothetical protein DPMN_051243 [Dreissena polymorpha]|uniref:CCHC-type domain-containing protein n=1 Tax=Dreissena polymorpha TaxID=45954 RepID=A0A9D4HNU0_DREPO|nr:hypothetical protein DPMN_051243 [Dreissena polymorpha]